MSIQNKVQCTVSKNHCLLIISLMFLCFVFSQSLVADNFTSIDQIIKNTEAKFPDNFTLPIPPSLKSTSSILSTTYSDSFTDSQGRTMLYRYSLPDNLDPNIPQEVLIYFHGNNTATQQEILDSFFPSIQAKGDARGIIPIVVASPETRPPPQEGVRQWYLEDKLLLQEFLQSNFEGNINTDLNKIYFLGGSQGSCFIHDFTMEYGENYGGGFFGGCGCYNSPDQLWEPSDEFKNRFKVLIHSSTEDFLYDTSQTGYGYYRYTIGLNTRGDLEQAGAHCSNHWSKLDEALDWFTNVVDIPEDPFLPHWKRINAMENIVAITVEENHNLWIVQQNETNQFTLWKSSNKGVNWHLISQMAGVAKDLDALGGSLFLSLSDGLYKSIDDGMTFDSVLNGNTYPYNVVTDHDSILYIGGSPIQWSDDFGQSWHSLASSNSSYLLNLDPVTNGTPAKIIATESVGFGPNYIGSSTENDWMTINDTVLGPLYSATLGQNILWGFAHVADQSDDTYGLYKSEDMGSTWDEVVLPSTFYNFAFGYTKGTVVGENELLIHGGFNRSWLTEDAGSSWKRILGLKTVLNARVTNNSANEMYLFDSYTGKAAYQFVPDEIVDYIFLNGFE